MEGRKYDFMPHPSVQNQNFPEENIFMPHPFGQNQNCPDENILSEAKSHFASNLQTIVNFYPWTKFFCQG